jgi:hypothetical protein
MKSLQGSLDLLLDHSVAGPTHQEPTHLEVFSAENGSATSSAVLSILASASPLRKVVKWIKHKRETATSAGLACDWAHLPVQIKDMYSAVLVAIWADTVFILRPPTLASCFQVEPRSGQFVPMLTYRQEANSMDLLVFTNKYTVGRDSGTSVPLTMPMTRCLLVVSALVGGASEGQLSSELNLEAGCSAACGNIFSSAKVARKAAVHLLTATIQKRQLPANKAPMHQAGVQEAAQLMMHSVNTHRSVYYENSAADDAEGTDIKQLVDSHEGLLISCRSRLLGRGSLEFSSMQRSTSMPGVVHQQPLNDLLTWRRHLSGPRVETLLQQMTSELAVKPCLLEVMRWLRSSAADQEYGKQALAVLPCGTGKTAIVTFLVAAARRLRQQEPPLLMPLPPSSYTSPTCSAWPAACGPDGGWAQL